MWGSMKSMSGIYKGIHHIDKMTHVIYKGESMKSTREIYKGIHQICMGIFEIYVGIHVIRKGLHAILGKSMRGSMKS